MRGGERVWGGMGKGEGEEWGLGLEVGGGEVKGGYELDGRNDVRE